MSATTVSPRSYGHRPSHSADVACQQNTSTTGGIADKVSNAASYVSETAKEMTSSAHKEGHKVSFLGEGDSAKTADLCDRLQEQAKGNTGEGVMGQMSGAAKMMGDKMDEISQ